MAHGDIVETAVLAAEALKQLPQCLSQSFELRVLRIPAIHIEGFWLQPQGGDPLLRDKGSFVIPHLTILRELNPTKLYPIEEFFETIRPIVKNALENDKQPAVAEHG